MKMYSLSLTRIFALVCCTLIITCATSALAETWYIKPSAEIPLRRGQGSEYKILAIIGDGTAVTVLEEGELWAKVSTENGEEGWMLKRYLSKDLPLDKVVKFFKTENTKLKENLEETKKQNAELQSTKEDLEGQLEKSNTELSTTADKYQTLVEDTENVITMKNELIESRQTVTSLQQKMGSVVAENQRLKASQNIRWFLAGGGTLIFGCIVGMILARSGKKRKSSLY